MSEWLLIAMTQPGVSLRLTGAELALIIAGGILTLAMLGVFAYVFIRAAKERPSSESSENHPRPTDSSGEYD